MQLGPYSHVWASHPQVAFPDLRDVRHSSPFSLSGIKICSSCTPSHHWQGPVNSPGATQEGTAHLSTHCFYLKIHIHKGNAHHSWQRDPQAQDTCRRQTDRQTDMLSLLTPHDTAAPGRAQGAELLRAITVCLAFLGFSITACCQN